MKRLLTSAAVFLCCVATTFAQFSGSGAGTPNDPYLIMNPVQLNQMRNFLNQEGVYFKMMADVDLTEFLEDENPSQGWQPVGNTSAAFKGILDGNGKSISGLWINRSNIDYVGLFGYTSNATIKNLVIKGKAIKGNDNVGIVSGYGEKTSIKDCSVEGSITGNSYIGGIAGRINRSELSSLSIKIDIAGKDYSGGVIGLAEGHGCINSCNVVGDIIQGSNYVGGVCGSNMGKENTISACYCKATISGNDFVGGICGEIYCTESSSGDGNKTSDTRYCGFVGNITGKSNVGGIVGRYKSNNYGGNYSSEIKCEWCYAVCNIDALGDNVGGITGSSEPYWVKPYARGIYYYQSYFCGSIRGNNNVGGLVGLLYCGGIINCYSYSNINGSNSVGGLCGLIKGYSSDGNASLQSNISNSTFIKAVESNAGRIYGKKGEYVKIESAGTIQENKSYNRTIVFCQGIALNITDDEKNGTGVSATTLKLKATYVAMGWDFTNNWEIQETECFPYIKTQTAPPLITSQLVSGATTISGKCVDGGVVTLEIDGKKQQTVSSGNQFIFDVNPLQAGHEVRISAKVEGKEQSYFTTETVQYLGSGKENDPYQVYTASDLTGVYRKGYFKLMNDIDLTDYINQFSPTEGWQSIGREGSETIHFDGNGKKITGLWCNSTRANTGLFSCFANGTIKNLTVEVATGKQVKGGVNTGILIGKMINGTIENCCVSGTVAGRTPVGGMVGLFDDGKISTSQANVIINTTGGTSYVGGLVGEITSGEIDQCITLGTLTATGGTSYVGGLVGKNSSTITNSYSTANITSSYNAAGIAAYNYSLVDKCLYTGNLYSNSYAAGIIGYNDGENAVVKNCVATSNKIDVTYESQQQQQGGGYGQRIIGGIKNNAPAPEMNNYALKTMQVSVNNVAQKVYDDIMNGAAKTEAELKGSSTYQTLGWDFDNVWKIEEGTSYPYQTIKTNGGTTPSDPDNPDPDAPKCATPTISFIDGKILFGCETENVEYVYSVTPPSAFSGKGNDVNLSTTYRITVYASKEDYQPSDSATMDIDVGGGAAGIKGDVNEDGTVNGTDIQEVINIIVNAE